MSEQFLQSQINDLNQTMRRHTHDGFETQPITITSTTNAGVRTVTNDTNVTGAVSGSNLSLGWIGQLAVSRGGTGASTLGANLVLLGEGASAVSTVVTTGNAGYVLTSNGAGADPSFQAVSASAGVPNWVDEGSLTWSAETSDKTLTITNTGKTIYQIFVHFKAPQAIISMQVSGKTSNNYDYTMFNPGTNTFSATSSSQPSAQLFNTAGGSAQDAVGVITMSPGTGTNAMSWTCRFNAGIIYADRGDFSGTNATLTSLTFLINGQTLTGQIHAYSLNL